MCDVIDQNEFDGRQYVRFEGEDFWRPSFVPYFPELLPYGTLDLFGQKIHPSGYRLQEGFLPNWEVYTKEGTERMVELRISSHRFVTPLSSWYKGMNIPSWINHLRAANHQENTTPWGTDTKLPVYRFVAYGNSPEKPRYEPRRVEDFLFVLSEENGQKVLTLVACRKEV